MKIIPYHSIPKQPKELRKKLEEQGELVVTMDGEPMALVLPVPKGDLEDFVILVSQIRSQLAVAGIRQSARESVKAQMTDAEIDSVIQEVRAKRRSKQTK